MRKNILIIALVLLLVVILGACSAGSKELTITQQPQDAYVNYPEGATFSVKVSSPRSVESYQWVYEDKVGKLFVLEGLTAKTETLVFPSSVQYGGPSKVWCEITAKDGTVMRSESAVFANLNDEEDKPVFYVGEYPVEPGQTLDLSKVKIDKKHKLGKGTVSFDANGKDITISNVEFDNRYFSADPALSDRFRLPLRSLYSASLGHPDEKPDRHN